MLMDLHNQERGNRDYIAEYLKIGKLIGNPEHQDYTFVFDKEEERADNGRWLLISARYRETDRLDKALKELGITDDTAVTVDGEKIKVIDLLAAYTGACLAEAFLNGWLEYRDIAGLVISGKEAESIANIIKQEIKKS